MNSSGNKVLEELVLTLHEIKAIKFGSFKLKCGAESPFYIDLRCLVSFPDILKTVSKLYWDIATELSYDVLCGVPYTALPIATCISVSNDKSMVMTRKEAKNYGTKQMVEGRYNGGEKTLVIEDVLVSGSSILETVNILHNSGLKVSEAIVLVDRGHGGTENLAEIGITTYSILKFSYLLETLIKHEKITEAEASKVQAWHKTFEVSLGQNALHEFKMHKNKTTKQLSYSARANLCTHSISKKLLTLMDQKQSNLCVAVDFTKTDEILKICDEIGPYVVMIKLHVDIIEDFSLEPFTSKLSQLAVMHKFLIFEDRKFADIGSTVAKQYSGGMYKISNWSHIINAHVIAGPGVISGLKQGCQDIEESGCVLVAQMSSEGNLMDKKYALGANAMAEKHQDFVIGFISQAKISNNPKFIHMTPGVHISSVKDNLGQQYITPEEAIISRDADVIIVGRGITASSDPIAYAKTYQTRAYLTHKSLVDQ